MRVVLADLDIEAKGVGIGVVVDDPLRVGDGRAGGRIHQRFPVRLDRLLVGVKLQRGQFPDQPPGIEHHRVVGLLSARADRRLDAVDIQIARRRQGDVLACGERRSVGNVVDIAGPEVAARRNIDRPRFGRHQLGVQVVGLVDADVAAHLGDSRDRFDQGVDLDRIGRPDVQLIGDENRCAIRRDFARANVDVLRRPDDAAHHRQGAVHHQVDVLGLAKALQPADEARERQVAIPTGQLGLTQAHPDFDITEGPQLEGGHREADGVDPDMARELRDLCQLIDRASVQVDRREDRLEALGNQGDLLDPRRSAIAVREVAGQQDIACRNQFQALARADRAIDREHLAGFEDDRVGGEITGNEPGAIAVIRPKQEPNACPVFNRRIGIEEPVEVNRTGGRHKTDRAAVLQ